MSRKITHAKAITRFEGKVLKVKGHKPSIEWTGDTMDRTYGAPEPDIRDKFEIKCACGDRVSTGWGNWTNKDGSIPQSITGYVNRHMRNKRPVQPILHDPEKIVEVKMKRGNKTTEYWVAYVGDDEFFESTGTRKPNTHEPWGLYEKRGDGSWRIRAAYKTRDMAVGYATKLVYSWEGKGYDVETLDHTSSGHVPPAATVAISVRKLINEYKDATKLNNPVVVKAWLDKVSDALTQMELLHELHETVEEAFHESLDF
jgi:hypothetical protein